MAGRSVGKSLQGTPLFCGIGRKALNHQNNDHGLGIKPWLCRLYLIINIRRTSLQKLVVSWRDRLPYSD